MLNLKKTLQYFCHRCPDCAGAITHIVFHGFDIPSQFVGYLFYCGITLTECHACCDTCGMAVDAAQSIGLAKIMSGIGVCYGYKVAHDADDLVSTKERIGAFALCGRCPLVNPEWLVVRYA